MPEPVGLAFKAYEIEELADVCFFRPAGMLFARSARALRLTPTMVTVVGGVVGIAGGVLLYWDRLGLIAFALIILHGVLDSADGQLARMTGQVTDLGRTLDGIGGYVTHSAAYLAIGLSMLARGGGASVVALMIVAGVCTVIHAQQYDYQRTSYARIVLKGAAVEPSAHAGGVVGLYERMQRAIAGRHPLVEAAVAARAVGGIVRPDDRARYREIFYAPVRGWNVLGDNTRFYALGVLALVHRLDWFFVFVLVLMNAAFVGLWLWQRRADGRFLAGL